MFLHLSVILSTGSAIPPPPPRQTPPGRHPSWADTPLCRHPLGREPPPQQTPPGQTPPYTVHAGIRSTSGWYSSYWNAILLTLMLLNITENWSFAISNYMQGGSTLQTKNCTLVTTEITIW